MEKDVFVPNGGLNQDMEEFFLPKGDYIDAKNIVIDAGNKGGASAIKKIEGVASVDSYSGTIKAVTETKEVIYFVTRHGNTARIYKLANSEVTELLNYQHSILVADDFSPDIKVLGDVVVWNYYKGGTPLSWYFGGSRPGGNIPPERIKFAKQTPNFIFNITKNISSTTAKDFLEQNDFQFAATYKYDSNEMSALGPISICFKAEPNVSTYTINKTITNKPLYAKELDLYARVGNAGVFRRIHTFDISDDIYNDRTILTSFTWSGQTYEALDSTISGKLFDNIPVETKAIEVADNRIFLANNQDDYVNDATGTITISIPSDNGYELPTTSGTIKNYFSSSNVTEAGVNSTEDGTANFKAFANNSEYAVGYAFYDDAMKTRGVESTTTFQTNDFAYPIIPTVQLTLDKSSTECFPSWAKYLQILYSKNLNKTFFYEGYASAFWFELQEEGLADPFFTNQTRTTFETRKVLKLNISDNDLKNVKFLVISLMGMFRDEKPYNYQDGDRIRINLVSNSSASDNILDMKISGQVGALLYVEYTGGSIDLQNAFSYPEKNFFEIYTPKEIAEDENLIFYESGTLLSVDDFDAAGNYNITQRSGVSDSVPNQQPLGDSIFEKLDLLTYTEAPFQDTVNVASSESAAGAIVTTRNSGTNILNKFYSSTTTQGSITGPSYTGSFLSFVAGSDLAKRTTHDNTNDSLQFNNSIKISDNTSSNTVKLISGKLRLQLSISNGTLNNLNFVTTITLFHVDSDGTEVAIGTAYSTTWTNNGNTVSSLSAASTEINFASSNHTFGNLSSGSINKDIDYNDKLRIKVSSTIAYTVTPFSGSTATVTSSASTSADPIQLQVNHDYRAVTTSIVFDNDAAVQDGGDFLIRTTSKAKRKLFWNTSIGKPNIRSIEKNIARKINNIRYGGKFVQGTNINDISSFFILDRKDVPHENGAIQVLQKTSKLQAEGQVMLCICDNETSSIYLNERILSDGAGNSLVAASGKVLGTVRNLKGSYGTADRKSVVQYKGNVFWWDSKTKNIVRYNRNGLTPISDLGMKKYFKARTENPVSYILPEYDMYVVDFGTNKAVGFNNRNGRWVSFYNGAVDMAIHMNNETFYFKTESIKKTSSSNYDTYVDGQSSEGFIQYKLNAQTPVALENMTILQNGGDFVDYAQTNNIKSGVLEILIENENGQTTTLLDANFMLDNKYMFAHILRDSGSAGGLVNGDFMIGSNNKIKLRLKDINDTTNDYKINAVSVGYNNSAGHTL